MPVRRKYFVSKNGPIALILLAHVSHPIYCFYTARAFANDLPSGTSNKSLNQIRGTSPSSNRALLFRSASNSELLIDSTLAQLHSVFFGLLFAFEQSPLDSLNLDNRLKLFPGIKNTNGRGGFVHRRSL